MNRSKRDRIRRYLEAFDFSGLFTDPELGWDWPESRGRLRVPTKTQFIDMEVIAEKRAQQKSRQAVAKTAAIARDTRALRKVRSKPPSLKLRRAREGKSSRKVKGKRKNGARGTRDIEGKATRVGASKPGGASFN